MFIFTPLLEPTWRKYKSLGLQIVFASGHKSAQILTDSQRVSLPGPFTGLQAFSQLDHTKELPGCSCLSQDKNRNACLCSPFIRLCLHKHRVYKAIFINFALNIPKNSSNLNTPSIVSMDGKSNQWETREEEEKLNNKYMFIKHSNSNTKYLYQREKYIF